MSKQREPKRRARTTLSVAENVLDLARKTAEERGSTISQVFSRGLKLANFLDEAVADGGRVLIERKDKTVGQLVILP